MKCIINDCHKDSYCKKMCKMHYTRVARHGDPNVAYDMSNRKRRTEQPCSVYECTTIAWQKTWCKKHYKRWYRNGDPLLVRTKPTEEDLNARILERKARVNSYNKKKREAALIHYSKGDTPACVCCGEIEIMFLSIDHINGGGNIHRAEESISNIAHWLCKNNYPEGFQTLCHNCNMAKGFYGQCPHQVL